MLLPTHVPARAKTCTVSSAWAEIVTAPFWAVLAFIRVYFSDCSLRFAPDFKNGNKYQWKHRWSVWPLRTVSCAKCAWQRYLMSGSCCSSWWLQGNNCWKLRMNLMEKYQMEKRTGKNQFYACLYVCVCDTEEENVTFLRTAYPFWIDFKILLQMLCLFGNVQSWWPELYGNSWHLIFDETGEKTNFQVHRPFFKFDLKIDE